MESLFNYCSKRFFISKALIYLLLSVIIAVIVSSLTFISGELILIINGIDPVSIFNFSTIQLFIGVMAMPIFYCLLTIGATFIFRNSGGGIVFSLGVLLIPAIVNMFSESLRRILIPILPQDSLHNLSGLAKEGSFEMIGITASLFILILWIGACFSLGVIKFQRNDFNLYSY